MAGTLSPMSSRRRKTETFESATLLQVCTRKVGPREGVRVMGFVLRWQAARNDAGHDLTITQFIDASGLPERTAYRQLREFRRVFDRHPGATPNHVLQLIEEAQRLDLRDSRSTLRAVKA